MISEKPKVSVIMPAYNMERYIGDAIRSVQQQTYTNWELILVDDCSPDNSAQVIESEIAKIEDDACIHLIRKEQNEGAARARNTGIDAAHGRYIAFLDADDAWTSCFCE